MFVSPVLYKIDYRKIGILDLQWHDNLNTEVLQGIRI